LQELEVVDLDRLDVPDRPCDFHHGRREIDVPLLAVKAHRDATLGFNAGELLQEIDVEISATKLTVGDSFQTKIFLKSNDVPDRRIFDGTQLGTVDGTAPVTLAGIEERSGAQEAADVIGAKRGCAANSHRDYSQANADALQRRVHAVPGKTFIMREQVGARTASRRPVQNHRGRLTIRPTVALRQINTQ
jgi:hypothetical protein